MFVATVTATSRAPDASGAGWSGSGGSGRAPDAPPGDAWTGAEHGSDGPGRGGGAGSGPGAAGPRGPFPHPDHDRGEHRPGLRPDQAPPSRPGAPGSGWGGDAASSPGPVPAGMRIGTPGTGRATAEPGSSGGTWGGAAGVGQRSRKRGLGAWARKWVRGEDLDEAGGVDEAVAAAVPDADDPAALLLAALGPTRRLWSRGRGRLDVGLGAGSRVALQDAGALGIAGPRARLTGVARSVVAQLAALHGPAELEIVLLAADRARGLPERRADWGWLGWLPHVRPAHGQDCRLLLAYDRDQAAARTAELTRRLDESPLGQAHQGPYTLLVVDGDPGAAALRDITARLAPHGPAAGIHLLALAETPAATPASPLTETYEAACASSPAFRTCGAAAVLCGDVATTVRTFTVTGGKPWPPGTTATADAVSAAWAERFARALAPLRAEPSPAGPRPAVAAALPNTARLLDELGLARATPASLMARWAAATDQGQGVGGRPQPELGSGRRRPGGRGRGPGGPPQPNEGAPGPGR
ncbi:cell division protein FtsK, partial [Streptomyces sp. NPDC001193]